MAADKGQVRHAHATIALLVGCTDAETVCERTGRCLNVGGGSSPIADTPPLEPAQLFGAPVATADAISSTTAGSSRRLLIAR